MLGAELATLRIARRLDQPGLAKRTGIAVTDIRAMEQGRFIDFADTDRLGRMLLSLCQVFEVDPATLTKRIFRLMADPCKPVSQPDDMPAAVALRVRCFYVGIFTLALIVPFAGLWWFVRA